MCSCGRWIFSISIHALRKESDASRFLLLIACQRFQSTLSVRRATLSATVLLTDQVFQSTLSVRRATVSQNAVVESPIFQSTLSVRRAT